MKEIIKKIINERNYLFFRSKIKEQHLKIYLLRRRIKAQYLKIFFLNKKIKERYIKRQFKKNIGYEIDFTKEPKTFNEKIQFRKLYDNNPLYSICSDKYRVREYVKERIGEEYLIPLLLVTDKLTEEQWDKLPNQFVAKANHNSGPVQIVKDKSKANKKKIIKELNNQLKLDYGVLSLEKYYSDIPRKIIVEEFLEDNIKDYKFFCFNGEVKLMFVASDRQIETKFDFYDMDFKKLNIKQHYPNSNVIEKKPILFEKMKEISKILSKDFSHVRIDLYEVSGKIYFGEMTFCHFCGLEVFEPSEWDYIIGEYWEQEKLK